MFHAVATAAVVVTGTAGAPRGGTDAARHRGQVHRVDELAGAGCSFGANQRRMTGQAGEFQVVAGVVAGQAVDLALVAEVEAGVLPAVADVAGLTERLVGAVADAEAVEHGLLAQALASVRVGVVPGPVAGIHHLLRCLGVATQAGAGDLFTAGEGTLQRLEAAVVDSGGQRQGGQQQDQPEQPGGCLP